MTCSTPSAKFETVNLVVLYGKIAYIDVAYKDI